MDIKHFKKATFASLILTLLLVMLPFATAHSGDLITAPPLTAPVTIDGVWSAGEWAEATQYTMTNSTGGNIGYIRVKYNSTHLLVIIDSIWDTTMASVYGYENAFVAIDTAHDDGWAPQTDDNLFHINGMNAWQGNTTTWVWMLVPWNFAGASSSAGWGPGLQPSPNSATSHRIDEMAIPLTHVGSAGSTVGFYVIVDDDSTDPDGTGWQSATAYSEWPPWAGGWPGWPGTWGSAPCPNPNAWGNLSLYVPPAVGGGAESVVNTLAIVAPWLILASAVLATVGLSVLYVKRRN